MGVFRMTTDSAKGAGRAERRQRPQQTGLDPVAGARKRCGITLVNHRIDVKAGIDGLDAGGASGEIFGEMLTRS